MRRAGDEKKRNRHVGKSGVPFDPLDRRRRWWLLLFWLGAAGFMVYAGWGAIQGFSLGDIDDNMRMMQIRALLAGQGWYDLTLDRRAGSNIHWSGLVGLPIDLASMAARMSVPARRGRATSACLASELQPHILSADAAGSWTAAQGLSNARALSISAARRRKRWAA